MDKYRYYIVIAIIAMIIPIIYKMTITHHEIEYKIGKYEIKELFEINHKEHIYQYQIKKNKEEYSFVIRNNAHKRKKIIKDIKEYKEGDINCIIPIYKNTKKVDIYCRNKAIQVSKYSLKENKNYQKILEKTKKYKIQNNSTSDITKEYKKITYYPKNISEEDTFIIWNYKGIVGFNGKESFYQKFLEEDLYDNIMATTTSRYFVLFENTSVNGIEKIHYYDKKKQKYKTMILKEKISKNSYINGVEDDLIYVTDKKKKKQYLINIKKETCKEIGNEEDQFIMYENGNARYMELKDFFQKNQYFHNERFENKKITNSKDLVEEGKYYYFKEDDNFYKQMPKGNKIFLFNEQGIESWSVQQEDILLKKEDSIYLYNDQTGLQKILEYNELKYNENRIYYLWK